MIFKLIEQNSSYMILTLAVLLLIAFIVQVTFIVKLRKMKRNYHDLTQGITKENMEEIMIKLISKVEKIRNEMKIVEKNESILNENMNTCIKTPELMKFNAFEDMGNMLSFSLALLDDQNDGVVVTSIYSRDESRFYAKPIKNGKSDQHLTPEEKEVINNFVKLNNSK